MKYRKVIVTIELSTIMPIKGIKDFYKCVENTPLYGDDIVHQVQVNVVKPLKK
jgi:hypothetical protein